MISELLCYIYEHIIVVCEHTNVLYEHTREENPNWNDVIMC
jgi:hypothetical protein